MTGTILRLLGAAGLAAAACLSANAAVADGCGKSAREATPACVTWWWEGEYDKGYRRVYAKNNCEGEMALKIDIAGGGKDKIWELDPQEEKRETYGKVVRDVRCCSNLGNGCDQLRLTQSSCENHYRWSSANETCRDETFTQDGNWCIITAKCETGEWVTTAACTGTRLACGQDFGKTKPAPVYGDVTSIGMTVLDADDVENCLGELRLGGC